VMNSILSAAPVNSTFSDDLADAVYPADAPDFVAEEVAPAEYRPFYPTPEDAQWWADQNAADDGRDFDSEADDALALDAYERGLVFA
jgi:hypothetical protein